MTANNYPAHKKLNKYADYIKDLDFKITENGESRMERVKTEIKSEFQALLHRQQGAEIIQLAEAVYVTNECKDGSHQDALKNLYDYFRQNETNTNEE